MQLVKQKGQNNRPKIEAYRVRVVNRKWLGERFCDMLPERAVGLALLDHPWMPKVEVVTSGALYIRFLGYRQQSDFYKCCNQQNRKSVILQGMICEMPPLKIF